VLTILGVPAKSRVASQRQLAQVGFQLWPVNSRVAKRLEERGLEAPHRMRLGEQVIAYLRGFDLDTLSCRQFHTPILARTTSRRRDVVANTACV
jgi:hypothetical protein